VKRLIKKSAVKIVIVKLSRAWQAINAQSWFKDHVKDVLHFFDKNLAVSLKNQDYKFFSIKKYIIYFLECKY
jgi:hypothetical protein